MNKKIYWTITASVKEWQLENLKTTIDRIVAASPKEIGSMDYHFWLSEDGKKNLPP